MTLRQSCLLVMLALSVMCVLPGCNKTPTGIVANAVSVSLSTNANGACVQTVGGNATNYVTIDHAGGTVRWVAPNAQTSCSIHFDNTAAACPFYSAAANQCDYSCSNGAVTSAAATGSANTTYVYGSVNIGGNSCTVGTNGIILDH